MTVIRTKRIQINIFVSLILELFCQEVYFVLGFAFLFYGFVILFRVL